MGESERENKWKFTMRPTRKPGFYSSSTLLPLIRSELKTSKALNESRHCRRAIGPSFHRKTRPKTQKLNWMDLNEIMSTHMHTRHDLPDRCCCVARKLNERSNFPITLVVFYDKLCCPGSMCVSITIYTSPPTPEPKKIFPDNIKFYIWDFFHEWKEQTDYILWWMKE